MTKFTPPMEFGRSVAFSTLFILWLITAVSSQSNCTEECPTRNIDVLFLLDGSGSIGKEVFSKLKDIVKNIASMLPIHDHHVQVGVVQYSHYYPGSDLGDQPYIKTHIAIGEHTTYQNFSDAVDEIELFGYTTFLGQALLKVQEDFKNSTNFGRKTTKQILILFTDGEYYINSSFVSTAAEQLKSLGVIPFSVGFDVSQVDDEVLRIVATGNISNDDRVFIASNVAELDAIAQKLGDLILGFLPQVYTPGNVSNTSTSTDGTGSRLIVDKFESDIGKLISRIDFQYAVYGFSSSHPESFIHVTISRNSTGEYSMCFCACD